MKRSLLLPLLLLSLDTLRAQEATLPNPDARVLGMGGASMATLSGSHAIYGNSSTAVFSQMPSQVSSSYYGQKYFDYYAVSGYWRFDNANLAQIGWRQFLREKGNHDMAIDLGYSRRVGERWAVGIVARYQHLKRGYDTGDALAVDLSAAWSRPLENVGSYSVVRVGAKLANVGGFVKKLYGMDGEKSGYINSGCDYTLPTNFTAGAALDTFLSDAHEVTVAADLGYCFTPEAVSGFQASVGAEYNLMQLVQLRAGYHYGESSRYCPSYGSVGAGVRFLHLRLDFAYLFAGKNTWLRNAYSISFGLDF